MPDIKEEEKEITLFVESYNKDFISQIEFDESPDARIVLDKGVIGIEHTRVFQPKSDESTIIQQQESIRNDIVELAQDKFINKLDHPHLNVVLGFEDYYWLNVPSKTFSKNDIDDISNEIVQFISKNLPDKGKTNEFSLFHGDSVPNGVLTIKIFRPDDGDHRKWRRHSGGVVPLVQSQHIQTDIDRKNSKVKSYYEKCDEIWLLLVVNNVKYERSIVFEKSVLDNEYLSSFDKFFLFEIDFGKNQYYELKKRAT